MSGFEDSRIRKAFDSLIWALNNKGLLLEYNSIYDIMGALAREKQEALRLEMCEENVEKR